ncbi:hypothetical protein ACGFMO_04190 [Streptomyces niveus]|uniref:hypothetical protein n=1 Tax=Streptomyces niveus TaxID=193462 RepID=UPI00371200C1
MTPGDPWSAGIEADVSVSGTSLSVPSPLRWWHRTNAPSNTQKPRGAVRRRFEEDDYEIRLADCIDEELADRMTPTPPE